MFFYDCPFLPFVVSNDVIVLFAKVLRYMRNARVFLLLARHFHVVNVLFDLVHIRPQLFVHRSRLRSIGCGRGGEFSGGGTRYVDMIISLDAPPSKTLDEGVNDVCDEEETAQNIEFNNIPRDELAPLKRYIDSVLLPAMECDAKEENSDIGEKTPNVLKVARANASSKNNESNRNRKRPRRQASKEAEEATRAQIFAADALGRCIDSDDEAEGYNCDDYSSPDSDDKTDSESEEFDTDSEHEDSLSSDEADNALVDRDDETGNDDD